ncbi:unnamed protein product [Phytomonas sp. Hart1]|nr:unnamed protein product [Phytomonas sp. Hart1]|eukprot:CCW66858.1 unnamed protein product [Phytomonas sp. isolate Hart1]
MPYFCVKNGRELLTSAAIKVYRQHGFILAESFFSEKTTHELSMAVRGAVIKRGMNPFPAVDPQNNMKVKLDHKMQPRIHPLEPQSGIPTQSETEMNPKAPREGTSEVRKDKNRAQQRVDRAFRRICRLNYHSVKAGLQALRGRAVKPIDEALDTVFNTSKYWCFLWEGSPALRGLLEPNEGEKRAGDLLGEAAAALSGEVVIRLYSDGVYEAQPFINPTPFTFAGLNSPFQNPYALSAMIGLEDLDGATHAEAPRMAVMPGSHRVLLSSSAGGVDLEHFRVFSKIFDMGFLPRQTPELQGLPVIQLPALRPGGVLFLHNFTLHAMLPVMEGKATFPYIPPAARGPRNPFLYNLLLMPDRCKFDGERNSWASRDSHGPLYTYQKGQPLTDDRQFPILHRALDIE